MMIYLIFKKNIAFDRIKCYNREDLQKNRRLNPLNPCYIKRFWHYKDVVMKKRTG